MIRTIISLDSDDKRWLDSVADAEGTSMTELVRRAVRLLRASVPGPEPALADILKATAGSWIQGDGLAYQQRVRGEWDGD